MSANDTTTPEPTPAQVRAAARATKRAELFALAVQRLLDVRAGVEGAHWTRHPAGAPALDLCGKIAALAGDLPHGVRTVLDAAVSRTAGMAVRLAGKEWTRQGGAFLRSADDLHTGSYATGVRGKPRQTRVWCALEILDLVHVRPDRAGQPLRVVIDAETKAGDDTCHAAAAAWRETWAEICAAADAAEFAETAAG